METTTKQPWELERDERDTLIDAAIVDFTMIATHVPNHSKDPKELRLEYHVAVSYQDRPLVTTPYTMGIAHIPGHEKMCRELNGHVWSILFTNWVREACTSGRVPKATFSSTSWIPGKTPILPDLRDVIYSLVMDGGAIDYRDFEDWAADYGYDTDSRKAEATYRACLEIGLKLRNTLGEAKLNELRELYSGY